MSLGYLLHLTVHYYLHSLRPRDHIKPFPDLQDVVFFVAEMKFTSFSQPISLGIYIGGVFHTDYYFLLIFPVFSYFKVGFALWLKWSVYHASVNYCSFFNDNLMLL